MLPTVFVSVLLLLSAAFVAGMATNRPFLKAPFISRGKTVIHNSNGLSVEGSADDSSEAREIARQLRERAQNLRREARMAEEALRSGLREKKEAADEEADRCIDRLLGLREDETVQETAAKVASSLPSAATIACRIEELQLSRGNMMNVAERLHERETAVMAEGPLLRDGFVLGDYENNSAERKVVESRRIAGLLDRLLEATQLLDETKAENAKLEPRLRARVAELRRARESALNRRIDGLAIGANNTKESIDNFVKGSMEGDTLSDERRLRQEKMMKRLIERPSWLPASLAPFAATSPAELSPAQWKAVKTDVLPHSGFVCSSWDCTEVAAVFRGRIGDARQDAHSIFKRASSRLDNHPMLGTKIRLFLVEDPEWRPSFNTPGTYGRYGGGWDASSQETAPPPIIVALPKEAVPEQESERSLGAKAWAASSTFLTIFTTFTYALSAYSLNPTFFNAIVNDNSISQIPLCLPVFFGVVSITAMHELGHVIAAKKSSVQLGLPVPLPSLQVGSFASITPLRSFPASRSTLFDVAVSGPGLSMIISLLLIVFGLILTIESQSFSTFPVISASLMKSSFLIGSICSVIAPRIMMLPLSQPIPVHPVFMVGFAGLIMSAVNLLPIGRLDGGRVFTAVWGRRALSVVSLLVLCVLAVASLSGISPVAIFWGAIVVMTQRFPDIPAVDEFTGVGELRANSFIVLLILTFLSLVPFPGGMGPV